MAGDEPDSLSDVFNFGKFKRGLKYGFKIRYLIQLLVNCFPHFQHSITFRDDDLINPVKDLSEKAEQLKGFVTKRGVCLILENDEFHPSLEISNRVGSGVDSHLMIKCFTTSGFDVSLKKYYIYFQFIKHETISGPP